jgi:hypothetical protein
MNYGFWILDIGFWILDYELWISGCGNAMHGKLERRFWQMEMMRQAKKRAKNAVGPEWR